MTSKLRITGLNLDVAWMDWQANKQLISKYLPGIKTDILLLPEMFSTGFTEDAQSAAKDAADVLGWMEATAETYNFAVAGSIAVEDQGKFYNRFYFATPGREAEFYDKRHLFGFGGEAENFSAGNARKIIAYKGWRIFLQVCYDVRFPVFSRNTGDYDVALYVANWPQSRIAAWGALLKARAIENQCIVFGLNRIGTDGNGLSYPESSACYFPDGSVISKKSGDFVTAALDWQTLDAFRKKFNFLQDRDRFRLL